MNTLRLLRDDPALIVLLVFWRIVVPIVRHLWTR